MDVVLREAVTLNNSENTPDRDNAINNKKIIESEIVTFRRLPIQEPIDIQFEDITYTASLGIRKETKKILHGINGRFTPGQLIAIMGPSGAGKSTLLDVLSGYRIKGVDGKVYTNGVVRNIKSFRKLSCYITQDDRLQPLLTVEENMKIAADLKLPTETNAKNKNDNINEILTTLNLLKTKHTKCKSLSGGQKKRLSIALELINNPLVMFLDEPTTGLDSSSCSQCVKLLKTLARQGRTIICTIHQPSATLFQMFDHVYVLSGGNCVYQGTTKYMISFFQNIGTHCPMYHNPADFIIELSCGEYGYDKIERMITASNNGKSLEYFEKPDLLPNLEKLRKNSRLDLTKEDHSGLQTTSLYNQLKVLMKRGYIKTKRDQTLTYLRIVVNIFTAIMLGTLYWKAGNDGSKVLDNYNLLFSILIHHMMSTMMLTILTFPSEMNILIKEHFNRWYSLKSYYLSVNLIDIPVSVICCLLFTIIIYYMSGQPMQLNRISIFFVISLLVVFVAQSFGLMIGAALNVINGTFLGPTLSIPFMMFSGFGVSLRDLPWYFYWGSYISYLRYGLEGYVDAIYGFDRSTIDCPDEKYCHYKYPKKLIYDIAIPSDQSVKDIICLSAILLFLRICAYFLLKFKLRAVR